MTLYAMPYTRLLPKRGRRALQRHQDRTKGIGDVFALIDNRRGTDGNAQQQALESCLNAG